MDKYFVIVTGAGESTRANLEALMEDYYYANGANGTLILPYLKMPNAAQVFAAQYAKDKNKDIIIVTDVKAAHQGMPPARMIESTNVIADAIELTKGAKADAFLLWNDEDNSSLEALALLSDAGIPCFDLTEGLSPISPNSESRPTQTVFPVQETIPEPPKPVIEDEYEEDEEEYDDEDDEDDDEEEDEVDSQIMDDIYFGIRAFAKLVAKELADLMTDASDKPQEADKA